MPGGDSTTGESGGTSNDARSSGASVMVSVDVGSLVSFDPKGDPHGIIYLFTINVCHSILSILDCTWKEKGWRMTHRKELSHYTQRVSMSRKYFLHWSTNRKVLPSARRWVHWMIISFQRQMCRLKGICSDRSHKLVMRRRSNLFVGFDSGRLRFRGTWGRLYSWPSDR